MRPILWAVAVLLAFVSPALAQTADPSGWQIVVALRKFQLEGSSNIHLYLYAMDGTLTKKLTSEAGLNEEDPVFSQDGKSVRFGRKATDKKKADQEGTFIITVEDGSIRPYDAASDKASFTGFAPPASIGDASEWGTAAEYTSTSGKYQLTRKKSGAETEEMYAYSLAVDGGKRTPIASLPGFLPAADIDGYETILFGKKGPFVESGDLAALFLNHHIDSTDGNSVWGLNLNTQKWTQFSGNGASIFKPKGTPGVFSVCQSRYEPLGSITVNCSYLDWWDSNFERTRFSPKISVLQAATIFRAEGDVLIINPDPDSLGG